ncbi:hypothetical protein ACHAPO_008683 [Fusarium lateritium]
MADPDILCIAQLGIKLSGALDLHAETCRQARTNGIPKLVYLINSTSATLLKVHELSQQARDAFTEVCLNDINGLAATCRILYEGILVLLVNGEKRNDEDKGIGTMTQDQVETLISSLAAKTYATYKVWDWLEPRLEVCQQELRHVKFELVLRFLLGSIAQFQLSSTIRSPGDWNYERSMRASAENIAKPRVAYHKKYMKKRESWTKKDVPSPPSKISIEEKRSVVTDSSSVTIAPSSVQVKDVMDKSANAEKDAKPEVTVSPATVQPIPQEKEDVSSILSATTSSSLNTPAPNWFRRLFSRICHDQWKNEDIEAYTLHIRNGNKHVGKLPVDEEEILAALRKLTAKRFWNKRPSLMEQFALFDQAIRQNIDEAIATIKWKESRDMTLVAMSATEIDSSTGINKGVVYTSEVSITLFFMLGSSYAPIYIIDANNKKWDVPYTSCQTLKMIRDLIPTLGAHGIYKPPGIMNCNYTISTDNRTITPENWESFRRPGMVLGLHVHPNHVGSYPSPMWPAGGCVHPPRITPMPKRPTMADAYQDVNVLLKLSDRWMPDEATMKYVGLGNLLRLWTNAIDAEAQDCDDSSDWSYSSGNDSCDTID